MMKQRLMSATSEEVTYLVRQEKTYNNTANQHKNSKIKYDTGLHVIHRKEPVCSGAFLKSNPLFISFSEVMIHLNGLMGKIPLSF